MLHLMILLLAVLITGCSLKKDLDDTKHTTEDMKAISQSIKTSQEYLTILARAGSTGAFSIEQFERVKNAEKLADKLELTTAYFAGMEHQYWLAWGQDTQELRESMWAKSVELFFGQIEGLVNDDFPVDGSWWSMGYKFDSDTETLGLLSVTMSKISSEQARMTKKFGVKSYSAYDLIKEGLQYKADYDAGKPVPEWAVKVLRKRKTALYLLQLRHNFYPLIVLSQMTNVEDSPKWFLAKSLVNNFTVNLEDFDKAELDYYVELLGKGLDARRYLEKVECVKPRFSKLTKHFYESMLVQMGSSNHAKLFAQALENATLVQLNIVDMIGDAKADYFDQQNLRLSRPDGTMSLPAGF